MAAESEESDFSEVLSDLGDERFEENRNEQEYGVEPYRFEPLGPGNEAEDEENEPQTAMDVERADRLGNTDWCTCGNCVAMENAQESVCCREITQMQNKILLLFVENPPLCITSHPGFHSVCLDMWVLQTAYFAFRQRFGRAAIPGSDEERYRYTAYRQLVRFCWGFLGKEIRVPLPSCAVNKIRSQFPSANDNYTGFRYAPLD